MQHKLLVVDDEPNNLNLLRQILKTDYKLYFATSGRQAIAMAVKHQPELILLDVMMPEMDGYQTCISLKQSRETQHIPVMFVTAMASTDDEAAGFNVGAVDYITKPVNAHTVKARINAQLARVEASILEKSYRTAIEMLSEAGHYNDTDTGCHIWRMADYAAQIALAYGWDEAQANVLRLAAPMHDTGKIGIPDAILKKPGPLNDEEWLVMKQHPQIGYQILSKSDAPLFQMAADIALCHHEKWNGKGYPNHLSGTDIPESARIVAIADVFDALTMKRPYKEPWPVDRAFAEIEQQRGEHFDPQLVTCFLEEYQAIVDIMESYQNNLDCFRKTIRNVS